MSDMITIKKIEVPKEFRKENMLRRLIKFESGTRDVVMYEVIRENWEHGTGHRGYEVMIVRYSPKDVEYFGNITPADTNHLSVMLHSAPKRYSLVLPVMHGENEF